jgi:ABC-type molybdate transport system permease subunit
MNKIKISTIVLIACLLLTFIFDTLIPIWLGISMGVLSVAMLVLLNIETFKIKGVIKKLSLYADVIVGLFLILTFIPTGIISYSVNNFLSHSLVFVFAGLLIAILVNENRQIEAI